MDAPQTEMQSSGFTLMKLFVILSAFVLSVAAFGQTICQLPATGPQPYSLVPGGDGVPTHVPGALDEFLGYIPQPYVALPGMPASPLAFCGPAWQPNYGYAVGNLIELSSGTVMQAVSCMLDCESGATAPAGFSGTLFEPSPVGIWVSTCSDSSTTAICDTVSATGTPAPVNVGEPYAGADVGATFVISNYTPNSAYNGSWVVTASTGTSPYTVSFAASGLGSETCTTIGSTACVGYQQGSQVTDNHVVWQDVGPQNESVLLTPTVTVTPSASAITIAQALNVTIAVSGGNGNPTPTGSVTLTTGSYTSDATTLSDGSATINIPSGSLAIGSDTLTVAYSGDGVYTPATGVNSVTVTGTPTFTITGTAVSVSPGATTGNASTVTVAPVGGFTGSVTLTAAVTSSPAGAEDLPTLSFGSTSPVNITNSSAVTATLTISTTAVTSRILPYPVRPGARWYAASGTDLMLFGLVFAIGIGIDIPARRRGWRTRLVTLVLLVTVIGGLLACGGGSSGSGNSGTTPGTYTVTVTGISGNTTNTGRVTLTVQ
jgi:hypothetical protein